MRSFWKCVGIQYSGIRNRLITWYIWKFIAVTPSKKDKERHDW